jgi:hypothetical protein
MNKDMEQTASIKFTAWELTNNGKEKLTTEAIDQSIFHGTLTTVNSTLQRKTS